MNAVVLFRFHSDLDVCRERLQLIRHLNPTLRIYGLYGGTRDSFADASRALAPWLDDIWLTTATSTTWKWLHQDFAVQEWFSEFGYRVTFDYLFDYEYDLLLARPSPELLPRPRPNEIAVSGLKRLSDVRSTWYWTSSQAQAAAFERYRSFMERRYGLTLQTYVTQGPFPVLPRAFLESFAEAVQYSDAAFGGVNCETSYPGIAEALGFGLIDTGLHPGWVAAIPSESASPLFHCERHPAVGREEVVRELTKPGGRRAFHPVKGVIPHRLVTAVVDRTEGGT